MLHSQIIGRYALYQKIASGGMATIHLGRLLGPVGFSRTVAIKRMHPQFTEEPEFVSMFLDEARLAARIRHPNVVSTLDVVATGGELFLVLEYIQGQTLARLMRLSAALEERIPVTIAAAIASGLLHGLHAAHEATNERGEPLDIVHRDVSPQNVMVGTDGIPRVLDFGVAKAVGRLQTTRQGLLKGKLSYMAPEQIHGLDATRRCDIYAAAVVLWEVLAARRLFQAENEAAVMNRVLVERVDPPSKYAPDVPEALDAVVMRGLARNPEERFSTAREMASAIQAAVPIAIGPVLGEWVERIAGELIAKQAARVAEVESASGIVAAPNAKPGALNAETASPAGADPRTHASGIAACEVTDIATDDVPLISQPSPSFVATPASPARWIDRRRAVMASLVTAAAVLVFVGAFLLLRLGSSKTSAPTAPSAEASEPIDQSPSMPQAAAGASANVMNLDSGSSKDAAQGSSSAAPLRDASTPARQKRATVPGHPQQPSTKKTRPGYNPLEHL